MAEIKYWIPIVKRWEGGYVNNPKDKGGETNMGITIGTWKRTKYYSPVTLPSVVVTRYGKPYTYYNVNKSLYEMTEEQWMNVAKPLYWDRWKADSIESQSIASLVVDWCWGSGEWGIKFPQRILGVTDDGIVGPKTIKAINDNPNPDKLFQALWQRRKEHFESLAKQPTQEEFLQGWLNRLNNFKYHDNCWYPSNIKNI